MNGNWTARLAGGAAGLANGLFGGGGGMVFLPIELWEKRERELDMLAELLRRERNRLAGTQTSPPEALRVLAEEEQP